MKVHVTGKTGFIGAYLTRELHALGHELVEAAPSADMVVHLAGIAHRHAGQEQLEEVNVRLAEKVARDTAAAGGSFVFLSSVKVHGEGLDIVVREDSPIAPPDHYAASKARAEERLRAIPGLRLTVLRPPLVYGPGVKANFLRLMNAVARGRPLPFQAINNRRSCIYVGNLADAIIRCLDAPGTFLLSDGAPVSTPQLCREIGEALHRPATLWRFPPALLPRKLAGSLEVDDSLIRRTLGWRPPYTRHEGLKATADWYLGR
jgi:nucleoside-diphosphate-sugar epimerase